MGNPTVIVGAGLAGLMAARRLAEAGRSVVVLEAGEQVGGRLATRRRGDSVADHGAQFFTVRSPALAAFVEPRLASGLVVEWCRGFNVVDGYPRYTIRGGMDQLAAHLAEGLDVRCRAAVQTLRRVNPKNPGSPGSPGYQVELVDGSRLEAEAVVLTPPVPLLLDLLAGGGIEIDPGVAAITYHRVLALLVTLDGPSAVAPPGGYQSEEGPFSFVADNHQKGISNQVCVTLHTNHQLSAQHWDQPDGELTAQLLTWAQPWLGTATVASAELVRWAHSGPLKPWPEPVAVLAQGLVIAGDGFAGPKVEGAFLSGCAAAQTLLA